MQLSTWLGSSEKLNIVLSSSLSSSSIVNINLAPDVKRIQDKIKSESTFYQKLTSYELQTTKSLVSGDDIPVKGFNDHLPEITNPVIKQARDKALAKINSILATVSKFKEAELDNNDDIVCPYEQTKAKYLGRNYIPPTINQLSYPKEFSIEKALPSTAAINAHYYNVMLTHMHCMSTEAVDTSFPGITSENIGNAFAVPVTTNKGTTYVINEKKLADHLEFAEIVRNLPMQEIIDNPKEIAYKLIHRFIQINSDVDVSKDLPFLVTQPTIPSLDPIPQPEIEPLPSPRANPLPIEHPALKYIIQPNYFSGKPQIQTQELSK
jgi:hypothetical protein